MQKLLTEPNITALPDRVGKIPRGVAYRFVRIHHYLHYPPRCDRFCLGVYSNNEVMGVMIFGLPVARLEDQIHTLELTRMALLPSPKNSESRSLSLAQKWIKKNHPEIDRLIAYADMDRHIGTIYKAANWREVLRHKTRQTWNRPNRKRLEDTGGCKIKYELILR